MVPLSGFIWTFLQLKFLGHVLLEGEHIISSSNSDVLSTHLYVNLPPKKATDNNPMLVKKKPVKIPISFMIGIELPKAEQIVCIYFKPIILFIIYNYNYLKL